MTGQQAAAELKRLCKELGRRPDVLSPEQTSAWLRVLQDMPYERGRAAVTHLVNTWARDSFPPPGALTKAAREASFEGHPNAAAYSQDGPATPWHRRPEAAYMLWRQTQIESWRFPIPAPGEPAGADASDPTVAETRYWAYVYDTDDYRRRCNEAWRREWSQREDAA